MSNERRIRLGELLIRAGLITELQLNAALAEQKRWGGRLGHILVEMNFISEEILVKGLARLLGVPRADLDHIDVPEAVLQRFDPTECQSRGFLPIQYRAADKRLTVAMVEVNDLTLIDELRFKYGFVVQPVIAGERSLQKAARALFYGAELEQAVSLEPAIKLVDNQGGTLVERRDEIAAGQPVPGFRSTTGVERPQQLPATAAGGSSELDELEAAQRRQARAIKSVIELLVEKGVFSREEFLTCVSSQTDQ
ncbi:MAG: general secretion pathway protein GspE [Deltaproteobacteria bacterium]|nr:general secretion pathway protein GspE [Deltaproteobacteria bacterium]